MSAHACSLPVFSQQRALRSTCLYELQDGEERGEREQEWIQEQRERASKGGTKKGTVKGESGASREGNMGIGKKRGSVSRECADLHDGLQVGRC